MITVGMNYLVREGKQPEFEERFRVVLAALRPAMGHSRSSLYRDVDDAASYLIISELSDERAFQEFIHSQQFRDVTDWGREQILIDRPRTRSTRVDLV